MGDTYRPIVSSGDYENGFFTKIPYPEAGFALVLTGEAAPLVIQNDQIPTKGKLRRGQYKRQFKVDMSPHPVSFEAELLSKDFISNFRAVLSMMASVKSPAEVVANNVTDVSAIVRASLLSELRNLASLRSMEQISTLRDEILQYVDAAPPSYGIQWNYTSLQLYPDANYVRQQEKIRGLNDAGAYQAQLAKVSKNVSDSYRDLGAQSFAGVVTGQISPAEAGKQLQAEFVRRMRQTIEVSDEMLGAGFSPETVGAYTTAFIPVPGQGSPNYGNETSQERLTGKSRENPLFAPPEEEDTEGK